MTIDARPVITRGYDGAWHADIYQLAVRYDRPGDVRWRLEAGYLLSPVGILPLESRADQNPMIVPTASYTSYLPTFEAGTPPVQLATGLYPLGAQATASATHWDLRAGVLGSSPVRVRPLTGDRPPGAPQLAFGGGVTPLTGLRIGGSFVYGRYAKASEVAVPSTGDRMATIVGFDADYAFGFTRFYVDWMHNAYERADGTTIGTALTATAVRTLTPRWYLAGRVQRQTTSDSLQPRLVTYGYPSVLDGNLRRVPPVRRVAAGVGERRVCRLAVGRSHRRLPDLNGRHRERRVSGVPVLRRRRPRQPRRTADRLDATLVVSAFRAGTPGRVQGTTLIPVTTSVALGPLVSFRRIT